MKTVNKNPTRGFKCSAGRLKVVLSNVVCVYLVVLFWLLRHGSLWNSLSQSNHLLEKNSRMGKYERVETIVNDEKITIGIASSVTGCGSRSFIDGAAILKYSFQANSRGDASKFNFKHYIIYHPSAKECVSELEPLGYTLLERQTPVKVEEIQGDDLRERIVQNGCCGEKELIKLEVFRLTDHPIIVHLDLDAMINKPIDDLLDFMLNPQLYKNSPKLLSIVPRMWPNVEVPDEIALLFTKDYNVVAPRRADKPYQGGFFVIRPSLKTYNDFIDIVREGKYDAKKGWGKKVGPFHGGMTIQGLLPWYYQYLHPGKSVEINRCIYNNMSDKPTLTRNNGKEVCRTNEKKCEDCRFKKVEDVNTFHFTICQKPWECLAFKSMNKNFHLCREMHRRWYQLRSQLEISWGRSGNGTGAFLNEYYNGYCSHKGATGYQPIQAPYGKSG